MVTVLGDRHINTGIFYFGCLICRLSFCDTVCKALWYSFAVNHYAANPSVSRVSTLARLKLPRLADKSVVAR